MKIQKDTKMQINITVNIFMPRTKNHSQSTEKT